MLWLHNLSKAKSQYISFGVILCVAALVMNIALTLSNQTSAAYDRRFEELNTAGINVIIPEMFDDDTLLSDLKGLAGVTDAERHEGVFVSATVREFQNSDFDMATVFYNLDEKRTVNRLELEGSVNSSSVCVPAYLTELGGFTVGGKITYSIGDRDYTWTISGTVSEMQYGNYGTGLIGSYLPGELYKSFADENTQIAEYSLLTAKNADLAALKKEVSKILEDKNIPLLNLTDKDSAKQSRSMVCNLLIAIFLALAAIILIVSIFLSNFKIRNTIEEEMTKMGVLKALGYTSPMIISGEVIPYTLTGAVATIVGVLLSYTVLPLIANILAVQSGFSFTPHFDLAALLLTILIPVAAILIFALLAASKIRKLQPINAIRGINPGGAGRNFFPLETAKTGVGFTLILKQIASCAGQNILLFAVSFGITVLMCFAGTLVYNVNLAPDNFMRTLQEEAPSVIFSAKDSGELTALLQKDNRVELVLQYASTPVSYADGSMTAFVCENFAKVTNDICYEGRNPKSADEIAVGSALADKYGLGKTIELRLGENTHTYTVTGFVQSVNNGGSVCELTGEGYKKLSDSTPSTLNVYLKEEGAEAFLAEYEKNHPDLIASSLNFEQLNKSGMQLYSGIVSVVTVVVFVISLLVVLLVMYVIINSMLTRRRQEFGIYKAIGYSSRQLIRQSSFSFLPAIALAGVLSAVLALAYMPVLDNAIFAMLGAYKNHFEIPLWFLLIFVALFVLACYAISVTLARPIKKITAYSLLKE